jgi:cold-inducible RNA-binding protein
MRFYVGGISFNSNTEGLRGLFASMGVVTEATIVEDKYSGQSKGFGFVEMPDAGEAKAAIARFNGHDLDERPLTVNETKPRKNGATEIMPNAVAANAGSSRFILPQA